MPPIRNLRTTAFPPPRADRHSRPPMAAEGAGPGRGAARAVLRGGRWGGGRSGRAPPGVHCAGAAARGAPGAVVRSRASCQSRARLVAPAGHVTGPVGAVAVATAGSVASGPGAAPVRPQRRAPPAPPRSGKDCPRRSGGHRQLYCGPQGRLSAGRAAARPRRGRRLRARARRLVSHPPAESQALSLGCCGGAGAASSSPRDGPPQQAAEAPAPEGLGQRASRGFLQSSPSRRLRPRLSPGDQTPPPVTA